MGETEPRTLARPNSRLARLFARTELAEVATPFCLPGGRPLFLAGEPADTLYFLRAGRLAVFHHDDEQEPQLLGVIRPGEPVGEMALIAATPHTADVLALRDSEVLAIPRDAFFSAVNKAPALMTELARMMVLHVRSSRERGPPGGPAVFAALGLTAGVDVRRLAHLIEDEAKKQGFALAVVGSDALNEPIDWFSRVEERHDFVLYVAEADEAAWSRVCSRQADRLLLVARGDVKPPRAVPQIIAEALRQGRVVDLVLEHPSNRDRPAGSAAWLDRLRGVSQMHQIRRGDHADAARLARFITGCSVGLVLSGGGARAYAHIGAIRALHEAQVPIDLIGGASMGAIIGAGLAAGWTDEEIDARIRQAFVASSPLADISFPMISMSRGERVEHRLAAHFDDIDIADFWRPYFCMSSNLTTGAYQLHRRGMIRDALRASVALPGVLPPVVAKEGVLVDGAVLANFPTEVMRSWHRGPVVGVDVSQARGLTAEDIRMPPSIFGWLLSGEWRKGPPIVSVLIRSATVSSARERAIARQAADLLITPPTDGVELRDWRAYAPAVEAGYRATREALDKLDRPVSDLRTKRLGAAALPPRST
jgi:NTE family protein